MPTARLAAIVEGHGDRDAVPILIRRIAASIDPALAVSIPAVIRTPKSKLVKPNELERAIELAARKLTGDGAIFVLIDADDDCPANLGPELLRRATAQRPDVPIGAVVAKHEFENWFIAAAESLRGVRSLREDLTAPVDAEAIEAAKSWLRERMSRESPYSEVLDQPALAARFDLELAERSDSFRKCRREVTRLLNHVTVR